MDELLESKVLKIIIDFVIEVIAIRKKKNNEIIETIRILIFALDAKG